MTAATERGKASVSKEKELYYCGLVMRAGSLGKSNRVCSVLCVIGRSGVWKDKATADTRVHCIAPQRLAYALRQTEHGCVGTLFCSISPARRTYEWRYRGGFSLPLQK